MRMHHFWALNCPLGLNEIFFFLKCQYNVQNFKTILRVDPKLWLCATVRPGMAHLLQVTIFFWKSINIISMYLLAPFYCAQFKKILRVDPKLWRHVIFRPKMALKYIFFRKPISKPSHVHSCLSTYKKPESDVNTLLRYWWLKNTEIWFSRSICGHNLRTRFFPHMWFLQNAKGS